MTFEKFEESGRGRNSNIEPMVSLRKSGSIGLNQATLDAYFDDNSGAVLYYDQEENRIGIEPVADTDVDEGAYTVSTTDSGATIAGTAFLTTYDLVPDITTQFDPDWDDENGLVIVDLDDPTGTYGSADDDAAEED